MKRLATAGAGLGLAALLASAPGFGSAQSNAAWPTFHGDAQHDGVTQNAGPTSNTYLEWTLPKPVHSSPAVDTNGTAYVGDDNGNLYAFSPSKPGQILWSFSTGGAIYGAPTLSSDGKTVYVASQDGNVYAVSTATGKAVWSKPSPLAGPIAASPVLTNDGANLFVPTQTGMLYELSTADGTSTLCFAAPGAAVGSAALSSDGGTVYIATTNPAVYGVSVSKCTGSPTAYYLDYAPSASPAVDQYGNVYQVTSGGTVDEFTSGNGTAKILYQVGNHQPIDDTPAVTTNAVYFGADDGNIYAIGQQSGTPTWPATHTGSPARSSPAVASNMIYVGSDDGNMYAFNTSGAQQWILQTGAPIHTAPAVGPDGSLWFANEAGVVYRVQAIAPPGTPSSLPPTSTPGPTATPFPTWTPAPNRTVQPTATAIPTSPPATAVPSPTATKVSISLKLGKKTVKPGQLQSVTVKTAPRTLVHFRVVYPNGDHQSRGISTNARGTVTYTYTQGASKIKYGSYKAKVIAKIGSGSSAAQATSSYKISFGKIDVAAQPRTLKTGQTITIYVHAQARAQLGVYLLFPTGKFTQLKGTTGANGWATFRFKVTSGLTKNKNHKVTVMAKTTNLHPNVSTKTSFTIK